jgi:hypothetical protein
VNRVAQIREFLEAVVEVLAAVEKIRLPELGTAEKPAAGVDQ